MATHEGKGAEVFEASAATQAEVAEYIRDLIQNLLILAARARMPRVVKHLEAASREAESHRDRQDLNS